MKTKSYSSQEGQSAVIVGLLMVVLVAISGLVVDGGRDYMARRQSQNASDGAAFAGTSKLALAPKPGGPSDDGKVLDAVNAYALNNGIASASDVDAYYVDKNGNVLGQVGLGTIPSGATRVQVNTSISFNPFLIKILTGGGPVKTKTKSAGRTGLLKKVGKLMPVTIITQSFNYTDNYQLQGDKTGPGGFQWLNFYGPTDTDYSQGRHCPSPDTPTLAARLNPYDDTPVPPLDVDDGIYICSNPGEHSSNQVRDSLEAWYNDFAAGKRLWTIPVYDTITDTGNNLQYHIVAFAVFDFSGYDFGGNKHIGESCDAQPPGNKCIIGRFVKYVKLGKADENTQCNIEGTIGICGNELVE